MFSCIQIWSKNQGYIYLYNYGWQGIWFYFFLEESVVLDSLKNALKMFSDLKIIDIYCVGNLRMVELHDHFEVKEKLIKYIELLEGLKGWVQWLVVC